MFKGLYSISYYNFYSYFNKNGAENNFSFVNLSLYPNNTDGISALEY